MGHLQDRQKQLSLRRLCKLLAVRRSTVYEVRKGADRFSSSWHTDEEIIAMMKKVRAAHQTWGFRLILSHLKQVKGEQIGKTRAYRLYQAEVAPDTYVVIMARNLLARHFSHGQVPIT